MASPFSMPWTGIVPAHVAATEPAEQAMMAVPSEAVRNQETLLAEIAAVRAGIARTVRKMHLRLCKAFLAT